MKIPIVSIIVPVFQAEKYLIRCIDSILNQSFFDWELILIDDGSKDLSGQICDQCSQMDTRIKVIHQKNQGVSSARNTGIDVATGEYITFIDADDYIDKFYLEKMINKTPTDLVICGFKNIENFTFSPNQNTFLLLNSTNYLHELVENPYYLDTPWCKLYKRSILENSKLRFDCNLHLSEDTLFSYEYLALCKNVTVISDVLYFYDGAWGGGSKYTLSYGELEFASKRVVDAINNLNYIFNVKVDSKYKCFHLSKLEGIFTKYKDVDIYKLYINSHNNITIEQFLGDSLLSPLTLGLITVTNLAKDQKYKESCYFLKQIKKFITVPIYSISFSSVKQKFFYYFLFLFGANIISTILYMSYYLKKR